MSGTLHKEIKALAKVVTTGKIPAKVATAYAQENNGTILSVDVAEETLRAKFAELAPNKKSFRRNRVEIFELIEETIDEILPARMNEVFDRFAEFKQFNDGDKAVFKMPKGRASIRRFIKRVALGVPMKRTRLDGQVATMDFFALGGAVYIEWEHYLQGLYSFTDLCNALVDELMNAVYDELIGAVNTAVAGSVFKKIHNEAGATFSETGMMGLISYASSYGAGGATIVCSPAFASRITVASGFISDADKTDVRERGYVGKFRGADVVVLPQQYNPDGTAIFDEKIAFVFPSGSRPEDKFVKIGFEGETQVRDSKNDDWSMEYEVYKKMGILLGSTDGIGLYKMA